MDETGLDRPEPGLFGAEPPSPTRAAPGAAYRVLARKYRPRTFEDLIGQEPMVRTLSNAFETGRIAQAYMLTGVRGVGKTTTARILARGLNYDVPGKVARPTIHMPELGIHCQAIIDGRHVDVIEMDAASHNGVGDIRDITDAARYKPVSARTKVYLLDEVHMLSTAAFNALLKTLEEPPEHVKFIFATTEIRKVPVTILSRCQRFDLRRIETATLVDYLGRIAGAEGVTIDDEALRLIARAAEGSARDSLSILDQAIAHGAGQVTAERVRDMLGLADRARIIDLFEAIMRADLAAALAEMKAQYDIGADPVVMLADLAEFTHYVTRLKLVPDAARDAAATEAERTRGAAFASGLSIRVLSRAWQILLKGIEEVRGAPRPLAAAEMVVVRLAYASDLPTPDELIRTLREQGQGNAGGPARPGNGPASGGPGPAMSMAAGSGRGEMLSRESGPSGAPMMAAPGGPRLVATRPTPALEPPAPEPQKFEPQKSESQKSEPLPQAAPAPTVRVTSLADIAALAGERRDIKLKTLVERCLKPVRFEPGRIEVALTPDTPRDLTGDLARKLQDWTGQRWMIVVSRDGGEPTLAQAREQQREGALSDARADPLVAAVMSRFPGAQIVDVRIAGTEREAPRPLDEPGDPVYDDFEPFDVFSDDD